MKRICFFQNTQNAISKTPPGFFYRPTLHNTIAFVHSQRVFSLFKAFPSPDMR